MGGTMQRNIDRLLKSTMNPGVPAGEQPKIIDEHGKIRFDRLAYDYDVYATILEKVVGFDYTDFKASHKVPEQDLKM
jgi:hypothetical protein